MQIELEDRFAFGSQSLRAVSRQKVRAAALALFVNMAPCSRVHLCVSARACVSDMYRRAGSFEVSFITF